MKDPEEIKKGSNDIKRFMKRITYTKSGEKATVEYVIDELKIAEEEKYDGYYVIATNLQKPVKEILVVSHKRYQIEDCFRIMKTNFTERPVNHRLPKRIDQVFMFGISIIIHMIIFKLMLNKSFFFVVSGYN